MCLARSRNLKEFGVSVKIYVRGESWKIRGEGGALAFTPQRREAPGGFRAEGGRPLEWFTLAGNSSLSSLFLGTVSTGQTTDRMSIWHVVGVGRKEGPVSAT